MNKLLILGATYHEINIIERARIKGIYTIVTDYNFDYSESPAKYVADEVWNISWSDIETLYLKCLEVGVNGVIAGFSEFRVESMIKLCEKLQLPCALAIEQLELTRNKLKFKRICEKYNILTVQEYKYNDILNFPVIVKPVDRAGSIGVNIAYCQDEFEDYYRVAYDLSPSKNVIIEDFIDDGIKVDVYYFVKDGNIVLLGTSDTIMCEGDLGSPILQKGWVFPSIYESQYINDIHESIKMMIKDIGLMNGYATMSAFYRNGNFYFFEAGFRLSGELSFNYYEQISGINYIDTLIDFSLGIENKDTYLDCFKYNGCRSSIILNFFGLNGIIKKMEIPNIETRIGVNIKSNFYIEEDSVIHNTTPILKKIAMYTLFSDNVKLLEDTVKYINLNLHIWDCNGIDVIYERVDENILGFSSLKEEKIGGHLVKLMYKPYWITLKEIQKLLNVAHETNISKGLIYATYNQSLFKLKEKLKKAICLIVFVDGALSATGSVQFSKIDYWYHSGEIGLLKLLAVNPNFRGYSLGAWLVETIILICEEKHVDIVVSDSAENNLAVKFLYDKFGFKIVDCCKYPENNFISAVYAKWLNEIPYTDSYIKEKYNGRRLLLESEK